MKRLRINPAVGVLWGVALVIAFGTGPVAAHEPLVCDLQAEPAAAPAGQIFVLSGTGYRPTELVLEKDGAEAVPIPLERPDAGQFEIPISSQPGDEGLWTATASDPDAHCSARTRFRVTLLDTATAAPDPEWMNGGGHTWPAVMYLLVIAAGLAGGTLLARRVRTS